MAGKKTKEYTVGAGHALAVGLVIATVIIGGSMLQEQRQSRLRPRERVPKAPRLVGYLTVDDLREPGYVVEIFPQQAVKITAQPNPSTGVSWRVAVVNVGPEGSPIAIKSTQVEGPPVLQVFQVTAVKPGAATVVVTATDLPGNVIDSVRVHFNVG